MSEKIKSKVVLTLTQKEAEWLDGLLRITKSNHKEDAQKATNPAAVEAALRIAHQAESLQDRLNSERWS